MEQKQQDENENESCKQEQQVCWPAGENLRHSSGPRDAKRTQKDVSDGNQPGTDRVTKKKSFNQNMQYVFHWDHSAASRQAAVNDNLLPFTQSHSKASCQTDSNGHSMARWRTCHSVNCNVHDGTHLSIPWK